MGKLGSENLAGPHSMGFKAELMEGAVEGLRLVGTAGFGSEGGRHVSSSSKPVWASSGNGKSDKPVTGGLVILAPNDLACCVWGWECLAVLSSRS